MSLERYRLQAQLGAGNDGTVYQANEIDGNASVLVCILAAAREDETRWRPLSKRLRLAAMLDHPTALAIRTLGLADDPPFVALEEPPADHLAAALSREPSHTPHVVSHLGRELARVLNAAHHLGLVHGRLSLPAVRLTASGVPKLDFTGLDVFGPRNQDDFASCRAPEVADGRIPDAAGDVYGLGGVLFCLLHGCAFRADDPVPKDAVPIEILVRRMLAADPLERPTCAEIVAQLDAVFQPLEATIRRPDLAEGGDALSTNDSTELARLGQRLGRFRLHEKLGQGGMRQVFRAEDLADSAIVAIKVMHPGVVAAFSEPAAAVRAGLELQERASRAAAGVLRPRIGIHHGPALTATLNDHLDYFGATVRLQWELL